MKPRPTQFGEMLTLYRASKRWTVRDLAPSVGISVATLSRIGETEWHTHCGPYSTCEQAVEWIRAIRETDE